MSKVIIFGAGTNGKFLKKYYDTYRKIDEILCFFDNDEAREHEQCEQIAIQRPNSEDIEQADFIIISMMRRSIINQAVDQLLKLECPREKIVVLMDDNEIRTNVFSNVNAYNEHNHPRVIWLKKYAESVYEKGISGAVAEAGVNRGDFAEYINKYFYDRQLYLFDTFSGFDERDLAIEREIGDDAFLNSSFNSGECFKMGNEDMVIKRMSHPSKCVIRKGYFPDSAEGLGNIEFCFVNLDMDLYKPILEGLRFFYPRMVKGGAILVHDYINERLPGVALAVSEYEKEIGMHISDGRIGDNCSCLIIK